MNIFEQDKADENYQRGYMNGYDDGKRERPEVAEYEHRLTFQRNATERLQAQIEAQHTKVVKARLVLEQLIKRIPGNLLDPYTEGSVRQDLGLIQAVTMAKSFLEDTQ